MKKLYCVVLVLLLAILAVPVHGLADSIDQSFEYELSIDGQTQQREVEAGDIVTIMLRLKRTDKKEPYTMYAMQSEIRYDGNFFELVEGSEMLSYGIQSNDIATRENYREFYMNYLSLGGGETWEAESSVGSFQLRVVGTSGVSKITNEDFLVSLQDGSGSYECTSNELTVIVSSQCTVKFSTGGGSEIEDVTLAYGEKLTKPEDPQKEGKAFAGWFKDIDCLYPWDFETDIVQGNITLYAGWADATAAEDQPPAPRSPSLLWLLTIIPLLAIIIIILLIKKK